VADLTRLVELPSQGTITDAEFATMKTRTRADGDNVVVTGHSLGSSGMSRDNRPGCLATSHERKVWDSNPR
jgi:hypothetical protein